MLSLLSRTTSRLLDVRFDPSDSPYSQEEDILTVDLDALRELVPGKPNIPWRRVVGACEETLFPVYRKLQDTLSHDVDHLAHLFSEMGTSVMEESSQKLEEISEAACVSGVATTSDTRRAFASCSPSHRKRRRSSHSGAAEILVIPSTHPSAPTIIITFCPYEPYESTSWVPCQDACFGNRLSVPNHPAVNDAFPPLLAEPLPASLRPVEKWQYTNGHWCAVLPTLEEQARRGLCSRVIPVRRKARAPRRGKR
ncbi:hypothetical protein GLOTRDRAFT_134880 [Gloeophyllum trabeum ATCC 11539]|uniref:Uncharacterized protein n=1 Tax=Gloeophyllum trabeum (strain ATCC 11539 / FP-39264 / Madison 617) TaxID=670483 RepID=S7S2V9_GLOTA|nr:uncharacterized protein GLOTRDRAFT_134880 [Gloeophyllum trabeum ATCC 11539]EPQ60134.1 hypothetical protein GLOTRDRAFT_134880 [Gloeophyllum trabeum ATCC 11539]